MIDSILRKIEFLTRTEKAFAVLGWFCSVVVFLFFLVRYGKNNTRIHRFGVLLSAVILFLVTAYGGSVVFADDGTEELSVLWVKEEEWPEVTCFKNQTEVLVEAQDVQLRIWICRAGEPWFEEVEVRDRDDSEYYIYKEQNGITDTESIFFDVPDGSAYRFVVQACRNGRVEDAVAFSIDKTKKTPTPVSIQTETPNPSEPPANTETPVITEDPKPSLSVEPGIIPEEGSPTAEVTPDATVTLKPVITEEPAITPQPVNPYVPERTEYPDSETDDPSEGSGESEVSEHTDLPEEKDEDVPVTAEPEKKAEENKTAVSPKPEKPEKKKENYTVTVRHDGSSYSVSSETMKAVENMYISEMSQLTVVELNSERLESSAVTYTLNGETVLLQEGRDYSLQEEKTAEGWKYIYRFKEQVFEKDGFYQVNILSSDKSGKKNNNNTAGTDIRFVKDKTPPVIHVTGLENGAHYPQKEHIYYLTVRDNTGPDRLRILNNGETAASYRYEDGNWINEEKEEILQTDGGTVKMSICTGGEECAVQFIAFDKSGNLASTEIYRVSTKKNGKNAWIGAVLPGMAAGCLILLIRKKGAK